MEPLDIELDLFFREHNNFTDIFEFDGVCRHYQLPYLRYFDDLFEGYESVVQRFSADLLAHSLWI